MCNIKYTLIICDYENTSRQVITLKKKKKKHNRVCKTLNHPTNPFEDDWDVRISKWGKKRASLKWGERQAGKIPTVSLLWKRHLSQSRLETRNAKHSWKLKVSQQGFDTSALTQQWLTFPSLLTDQTHVHCYSRVGGDEEKLTHLLLWSQLDSDSGTAQGQRRDTFEASAW